MTTISQKTDNLVKNLKNRVIQGNIVVES